MALQGTKPPTSKSGAQKGREAPSFEKFFYSRQEAANALGGLSVRTIDYLISDQKLRTRRIGRRVVIPVEDVRNLAAEIMRSDLVSSASRRSLEKEQRERSSFDN